MKNMAASLCGLLFGFGLALSGMTDTAKVIGFLDIFGHWKPDLLFVMGGGVAVTLISFRFILRCKKPLLDKNFDLPSKTHIDRPLVLGAVIFGIGWGLYGYCPGPAIASVVYWQTPTIIFLVSMTIGMASAHYFLSVKPPLKK